MFTPLRNKLSCAIVAMTALAAPSAYSEMIFTDVTSSSGIASEAYGGPTRHSLGVVWLDVNNDGHVDIFASNGFDTSGAGSLRPHLYLGSGTGQFSLADDLLPDLENYEYVGAAAADYDRDGDVDIFIYTANESFDVYSVEGNPFGGPPNVLLKNGFVENGNSSGRGQFIHAADEAGVSGCTPRFQHMILADDPTAKHTCSQTRSAFFFDYDLDGWVDLYLGQMVINRATSDDPQEDALGKRANMDIILRNQGDGTFRPVSGAIVAGNAIRRAALVARGGHLDGDMWPDVYVGNIAGPNLSPAIDLKDAFLKNNGAGKFGLSHGYIGTDTPAAMGTAMGDVNGDGLFDLYITDVVTHPANGKDPNRPGNTLYLSHMDGFSQNMAKTMGVDYRMSWGANFSDFDRDGSLDLFVGTGLPNRESIVFSGLDSLSPKQAAALPTVSARGSALSDYDRDGDQDVLIINQGGGLQLYRNDSTNPTGTSFTLNVTATQSNPDAIGLRADLYTVSGKRLSQQITGGNSAHSQDEGRTLVFGIGDEMIDRLEIRWPHHSLPVQIIDSINTDSLSVTEPLPVAN